MTQSSTGSRGGPAPRDCRQDQMAFHGSLPRSHAVGIDRSNCVLYKDNADDKSEEESARATRNDGLRQYRCVAGVVGLVIGPLPVRPFWEKVDIGQLKLQGVSLWVSLPVSGFEGSARRSSHPGRRARAGIVGGPGRATRDGRSDQGGTTVGTAGGGDTHGEGAGQATAGAAIDKRGRPATGRRGAAPRARGTRGGRTPRLIPARGNTHGAHPWE